MKKYPLYYLLLSSFCIWLYAIQPNYAQTIVPTTSVLTAITPTPPIVSTATISPLVTVTAQITPTQITSSNIITVDQVIPLSPNITKTNLVTPLMGSIHPQTASRATLFEVFTFESMGIKEQVLNSPLGMYTLRFGLPASQQLITGTQLDLDFTITSSLQNITPTGSLQILFNRILLTELPIVEFGAKHLTLPISPTALIPQSNDGRHELNFRFQDSGNCDITSLTISPLSFMTLSRQITTPLIDLQLLPRPIYQKTFLPDATTLVLPDKPTTNELQAALATINGLSKMTEGWLVFSTTTVSALTPLQRASTHLIFVGGSQSLMPLLKQVALPAPIGTTGFEAAMALPDDGIVQMALSPWNKDKVVLVVGGNSELAIFKAGQSISTGQVRTANQPNLAIIADLYRENEEQYIPIFDETLGDLGYNEQTVSNSGDNRINIPFNIPLGYFIDGTAYFNLVYNHTSLVDFENSSVTVKLGSRSLKSVRLTPEGANPTTLQVTIPRSLVHEGTNNLLVVARLTPDVINKCISQSPDDFWFTVWPDSSFHLPLAKNPVEKKSIFQLVSYPSPFNFNKNLTDTVFLLPSDSPIAWDIATQVAFNLGWSVPSNMAQFKVAFADNLPEELRQNHHIIAIGLPSQIPLVAELKEILPAAFEAGSDLPIEAGMLVRPRLITGANIGYLQIVPLPWNQTYSILMVLGTNTQGLQLANTVLISSSLQNRLKATLAVIEGTRITLGDRQFNFSPRMTATTIIQTTGETQTITASLEMSNTLGLNTEISKTLASQVPPPPKTVPRWVFPAITTATLAMFIILLVVISSSWRQYYEIISSRLKKMNISLPVLKKSK